MIETAQDVRDAACGGKVRHVVFPAILTLCGLAPGLAHAAGTTQPIAPEVQAQGVDEMTRKSPMVPWKPGDPVRVVPDLRESGEELPTEAEDAKEPEEPRQSQEAQIEMRPPQPLKPVVRAPVAPQVMEGNVGGLPAAEPYEEGDPVRIVPDMKESGTEN
jgi:hypothetical protein